MVGEEMVPHDFALESACCSNCSVHGSAPKLSAEGCGYLLFVGVGMGGESDGMVEEVLGFFPDSVAMIPHSRPESWR